MSAKHSRKGERKPAVSANLPSNSTAAPLASAARTATATMEPAPFTPWIESSDPRKRTWGKVVLIVVWLYVAALWLLALDQTFEWGIFGPKVPPTP